MPKSLTMATTRSTPPSGNFHKAGDKNKKTPVGKSGKRFFHHQPRYQKRPNKESSTQPAVLLHRSSLPPSSSPPRGLLERLGGSIEDDEVASTVSEESYASSDGSRVLQEFDMAHADLPVSVIPRYHTPEPGEVERFLESVIGAPPSPFGHASCPVDGQSAISPVDHLVKLEPPTVQLILNSPSPQPMPDLYHRTLPSGDSVTPAPSSTMQQCRKRLASVLLISAHARDPASRLDSEQCQRLLSDDHCRRFIQKAKEMRRQLSLASPKTSDQDWITSLKRDRVDDVDVWVRNTRTRFDSANTVASDESRRDSDITLVDFPGGTMPPKAPRAMLRASQAPRVPAHNDAPYDFSVLAAPTTRGHSPIVSALASSVELAQKAINVLPSPLYASQPVMDTSGVYPAGDPSETVSPIQSSASRFIDCTQPGTWFKYQGSQYAEIVDIDIELGNEIFYPSYERQSSRLRMHLRLYSVHMGAAMNNSNDEVQGAIDHQASHWPKKGKLVLQVNPESAWSKTWLPWVLESDPLDVTSCIHPGKNTFRFIQLADLSEFAFVLIASPPPHEEEWRSWDWASSLLVDHSHADLSPIDVAVNNLSEFACLSVNVQS